MQHPTLPQDTLSDCLPVLLFQQPGSLLRRSIGNRRLHLWVCLHPSPSEGLRICLVALLIVAFPLCHIDAVWVRGLMMQPGSCL